MSTQVLANQATKLATSTPKEVSFSAVIEKNASRSVKGATRERLMLNRSKLFTYCCDEIRSMLGIEKGVRLPAEVADKLQLEIDIYLNRQISRINPTNILNLRRGFSMDFRNLRIVDKLHLVGENILALKEQHLGVNILITDKNKRLDDLMKKPNPDYELEASVKEQINKLELVKTHIEACLKQLQEKTESK